MRNRLLLAIFAVAALTPAEALSAPQLCVPTERPNHGNAALAAQRATFGFHDEELVLCSDGGGEAPVHIAARLWVPESCPGVGGCAGVVIAHGFGFNKEVTFSDMLQVVQRGMYVLSYDVRGQGASGGQATFLGRADIADQAAILQWWHEQVKPTKTAVYGISQGGWLAWSAAIFNCGAARSGAYDSATSCDAGGRWVDAIVPMQSPTKYIFGDGTCPMFIGEALVYSRGNISIAQSLVPCVTDGRPATIPDVLLDVEARLDRVDVPVYAVTSFYDWLVPPQLITTAYERLHARAMDPNDGYHGTDVRLTISNDGHGAVGGNFAVINDVMAWIEHHIDGGPPLREASVAIAQEWADGAFRLEHGWPIPGTTQRNFFLARTNRRGVLGAAPGGEPGELRNLPVFARPPEVPFANTSVGPSSTGDTPGMRLVYMTTPLSSTIEVTGQPVATIRVSSANAASQGSGQLHVLLSEVAADGAAHTFSQARIGLTGLGPEPVAITLPLTVSAHRIDAGNRLMLSITPSDMNTALPARGADPFYVHHDADAPSSIVVPLAPIDRAPPAGEPPTGAAFTDDLVGALCEAFGLPCST